MEHVLIKYKRQRSTMVVRLSHNQLDVGSNPTVANILFIFFMVFFSSPFFINLASTVLFFIGVCGVALNRRSVLLVLISVEIILLAINLKFITTSVYIDDLTGQIFSLFILTVAAAESSIGLAILVAFFRTRGSISI